MYHLKCSLTILINVFAFLVKANSKEICEGISFPSFFFSEKKLMPAFLLRFKPDYLENMPGYPSFSLWIPIALANVYYFHVVLTWRKNLCIQKASSLRAAPTVTFFNCYLLFSFPVQMMISLRDK